MISWNSMIRGAALGAGTILVASGCNSGADSAPSASASATSTVAADVPAGFDACTDLPQSLLQSEKLKNKGTDITDRPGGIKWRGCVWVQTGGDGYATSIDTTNITLTMVRNNNQYTITSDRNVGGREAVTYRPSDDGMDEHESCTMLVDMKSGGLEIGITNPRSSPDTGDQHSCDIAQRLAERIVPALPAIA